MLTSNPSSANENPLPSGAEFVANFDQRLYWTLVQYKLELGADYTGRIVRRSETGIGDFPVTKTRMQQLIDLRSSNSRLVDKNASSFRAS